MFDIFNGSKGKNTEKQLEALTVKLTEANKTLEKNNSGLLILIKATEGVVSFTDAEDLCKAFLGMFIDLVHAGLGTVLLEESGYLTVKEFRNLDGQAMKELKIPVTANFIKILKVKKAPCITEELCSASDFSKEEIFTNIRFYLDPQIFVPVRYGEEFLGLITLGDIHGKMHIPDDMHVLYILAALMGFALIKERLFRERAFLIKEHEALSKKLNRALEAKSSDLKRLNTAFASLSLLDAEKLKALMVNLIFETVEAEKAAFFLRSEDEVSLISAVLSGVPGVETKKIYFDIDNDFIVKLRENKKPLLIEAARVKETLDSYKCNPETAATLADAGLTLYVPFVSNERLLALLVLGSKRSNKEFTPLELELLITISFQFAAAIDNAKLFEAGVLDGLTKTNTRRFFENRLEYEIAVGMHSRNRRTLCLVMTDLDHFKQVNDTYGHQTGDEVLREFARIISDTIRMTDIVARYGGEEFVVILPELDLEEGGKIARRIQQKVAATTFVPQGPALKITASFGVSAYPDFAKTKEELINKADKALYRSKEMGRNKVTLCTELE